MIAKKTISLILPFVGRSIKSRLVFNSTKNWNRLTLQPKLYFCEEKGTNKEEKTAKKANPKEDAKQQLKEEKQEGVKLSEMDIDELIQMNTQQSLKLVFKKIADLEQQSKKNNSIIAELQGKLSYFEKHHEELTQKQQKLLANISIQQKELALVHKRSEREIQDSKDYAISKLASQLIETADNIKRCKQYAEQQINERPNDKYLKEIIAIHKQIADVLKLYDISQFDPTGELFNPNTSESLVTIPCPPGYKVDHVAMAMQTGYKIKNRILRSARVGIFI